MKRLDRRLCGLIQRTYTVFSDLFALAYLAICELGNALQKISNPDVAKETFISWFPGSRSRYLRWIDLHQKDVRFHSVRLFRLLARLRKTGGVLLSADYFWGAKFEFLELSPNLTVQVFIWNGEDELEKSLKFLGRAGIEVFTFFPSSFDPDTFSGKIFAPRPRNSRPNVFGMPSLRRPIKQVFFAGQVSSPVEYVRLIDKEDSLAELLDMIVRGLHLYGLRYIFPKPSPHCPFHELFRTLSPFHRQALTHVGVTTWRSEVLEFLANHIGPKLTLMGNDFASHSWSAAKCLGRGDPRRLYQLSAMNLDFGSQVGIEYVYPRSIEINSLHAGSLLTHKRLGLPDPSYDTELWLTKEDLLQIVVDRLQE